MRDRPIEQISRIAFASTHRDAADGPRPPVPHQVGLTNDAPRSPRRHLNITECLDARSPKCSAEIVRTMMPRIRTRTIRSFRSGDGGCPISLDAGRARRTRQNKGGIHRGLRPTSDMRRWARAPLQITITDVGRLFINCLATRGPPSDDVKSVGRSFRQ